MLENWMFVVAGGLCAIVGYALGYTMAVIKTMSYVKQQDEKIKEWIETKDIPRTPKEYQHGCEFPENTDGWECWIKKTKI